MNIFRAYWSRTDAAMYDLLLVLRASDFESHPKHKLSRIIRYIFKIYVILKYNYFENCRSPLGAGIAQSVQRLATGWTVRGLTPGGGKIFRTRPERPWDPPSLLYNGYRVFPGGKRPGSCVEHPFHLAPR
jgi:hypothetical protein